MTKLEVMNKNGEILETDYLKKFSKDMLKNTMFIGTFQEKRFVESLNSYRDVVGIHEEEQDFIENILVVKRKIEDTLIKRPWIGITEPDTIGTPAGYCLWVILPEEAVALGKFWYRVKTVEFSINEIRLKLEIVRPFKENSPKKKNESELSSSVSISLEDINQQLRNNFYYIYKFILTYENVKQSVIFIALLVSTILAACIHMIKYLLEYFLKLIRETTGLIKAFTPILINLFNVIAKVIFGFYHLIVTLYQGKPTPQPVYNSYYSVDPQQSMLRDPRERYNRYYPKQLPYYPSRKSGVTITPLDD